MPIGALGTAGRQAFSILRKLREELGVNTTCGASNISFGLPNRHGMNAFFLAMASGAGMTSAIMNPLHEEELTGIMAADRSEEHTSELQSLMRISYAVFCLKKKKQRTYFTWRNEP